MKGFYHKDPLNRGCRALRGSSKGIFGVEITELQSRVYNEAVFWGLFCGYFSRELSYGQTYIPIPIFLALWNGGDEGNLECESHPENLA
jgi:hypothetical protein